ncbi:MAG: hypothetical protein O7B25_11825 [Gammaproteobacteria bacterium]|nr:hypothetical protein [Gammaproteobacteria bacterium]
MIVVAALLLWKILAVAPVRNCLIFSTVYIVAETGGLLQLENPVGVVAMYGAVMLSVCGVVFAAFTRLAWARGDP